MLDLHALNIYLSIAIPIDAYRQYIDTMHFEGTWESGQVLVFLQEHLINT